MRLPVSAACLAFACAPSFAQDAPPPARSAQGSCSRLLVAGQDATANCAGKISSMSLPDGTMFVIFNAGPTMIGFSGRKSEIARGAPWPVRFVNIGTPGREPNAIPVTGICRFDDPARVAGRTVCEAKTEQGRFEAEFAAAPPRGRKVQ